MWSRMLIYITLGTLISVGITGCTVIKAGSSTTLPSSAYFSAEAGELQPLLTIARVQDTRMKGCHKGPACEDAYYACGLVALFQNRADAIRIFQESHRHAQEPV